MITADELNPHAYATTPEQEANLSVLLEKMNLLRTAYSKSMIVTSGLRSQADQTRINPKAPKSNHLTGSACDILDDSGELYDWCKANEALLVEIGLWMEERQGGWQHFQTVPPRSGKRWFNP